MKLFMIIYASGSIGGVAGPLPYDMAECERRRDEFRAAQAVVIGTGFSKEVNRPLTADEMVNMRAMKFECEYRDVKPTLEID